MRNFVEQRLAKNRAAEAATASLNRKLAEHSILAGHGKSELHVDVLRRKRAYEAERRDLFADYTYVTAQQEQERRERIAEAESRLAAELASRSAAKSRELMDRKRICDGSEELRSLKEKLHAAQVNKQRAAQMLESQVRAEHEKLRDEKIAEHMAHERLEHMELERKLEIEKHNQRHRVKIINQTQIAQKEAQREEAMQAYLQEKEQVDALVNRIAEEDEQERACRHMKQEETRALMKQFMREQKTRQEEQEQAERDENDRIEQYARAKREREAKLAEEREEAEREKKRILNQMLGVQEARDLAARELEQLRNDLHSEELEAEHRRREQLEARKKLEDREEMKNAFNYQMKVKEEKRQMEKEEEDRFREQLMQKYAEDDRIEQMNDQKRRLRVEQHKREAQRLLDERQKMYEAERELELEEHKRLAEEESRRQVIVEEERRRLLKEHAAPLRDFLPKGTMEHPGDASIIWHETAGQPLAMAA